MHRSNLMSTVTRLRTIFWLSSENQKMRSRHISYWKSRMLATSVALKTYGVSRAYRWAASVSCSNSVQYRITVWNSSWTQISRNLVRPQHLFQLFNRSESLHKVWQYHSRALCKRSIRLGTWEISYMKRRFHAIWVSDAFQTDNHYCTWPQDMNTSYGDVIYAYRLTAFHEGNHWSPMDYIRKGSVILFGH